MSKLLFATAIATTLISGAKITQAQITSPQSSSIATPDLTLLSKASGGVKKVKILPIDPFNGLSD